MMTDEEMADEWVDKNGFGSDYNNIDSFKANREMGNAFLAGLKVNKSRLDKAKELIKRLINACCSYDATGRTTAEAEQFLKEIDE